MFKKILYSFISVFMILGLVGCGSNTSGDSTTAKVDTKGKCDVFECIKIINTDDTYEQVVSKIGFEGEYTGTDTKKYYWELSEDTGVEIYFYDSGNSISIDFPNSLITKRADFSKWDEIETKTDSKNGLSYDELVNLVGNVQGVLTEKKSSSVTYKWLDANGGYLSAIFDSDDMKCSWISGWF